jgi:hypothetical protein
VKHGSIKLFFRNADKVRFQRLNYSDLYGREFTLSDHKIRYEELKSLTTHNQIFEELRLCDKLLSSILVNFQINQERTSL